MDAFLKTGKLGKSVPRSSESGVSGASQKDSKKKSWPVPWVEKYRPRNIDDVVQQEEVVAVLGKILTGADLPNLLFYGPPGTGKTSTILAAARQLFGDNYKDRILELNASDERGISVIREKVKKFSQQTASATLPDGRPCPPFKLIILDEADAMTVAAQSALRRTMEKETKSTRFCLLCNYLSRIIPPITSRCSKFRFKPLKDDMILQRLEKICSEEGVRFESGVLKSLIKACEGDLRRAITSLQSCHRLKGKDHVLTIADVEELSGLVPMERIEELFTACQTGNYDKVDDVVEKMSRNGLPAAKVLDQFFHFVLDNEQLTDAQKATMFQKISECNFRLMDGGSEYLQLMDLGTTVMLSVA
ncbi:Replication factor C subunit 4 [Orchesella cincta]|uniref:Replication factor C subunit 4 n=1 Tax=Orchesella cincta TaxID=48709 RepID=A0A1D2NE40_ORCCI|nr:Replication factor C subunit 4 [Orchesella cincta]